MLTFLLSGLWHGASWNFVLWGGWWGLWLVIWRVFDRWVPWFTQSKSLPPTLLRWAFTMLLVNIGWLMFREQSMTDLLRLITASPLGVPETDWRVGGFFTSLMVLVSLPLWLHAALQAPLLDKWAEWRDTPAGLALQAAAGFVLTVMWFTLAPEVTSAFIYFQF
jgi:hypothetical protein